MPYEAPSLTAYLFARADASADHHRRRFKELPCRPRRYPARRVAGRLLPGPVRHRLSSRFPRSYVTPIPPALLLLRLLVLRVALPS